jgi:hypothetical protein
MTGVLSWFAGYTEILGTGIEGSLPVPYSPTTLAINGTPLGPHTFTGQGLDQGNGNWSMSSDFYFGVRATNSDAVSNNPIYQPLDGQTVTIEWFAA